jgi:hypothetical protein
MPYQPQVVLQNSGIPFQQQSGIIPRQSFQQGGSKVMQGSIMPQSQFSNIQNASIAQSNYIPNYQYKQ